MSNYHLVAYCINSQHRKDIAQHHAPLLAVVDKEPDLDDDAVGSRNESSL